MGVTLYHLCAMFVLARGTGDLDQLAPDLRRSFVGEVLVSIAKQHTLRRDVQLDDVTLRAGELTNVSFTRLRLLGTDTNRTRLVADFEVESNDVQEAFPRSGHLDVAFHELVGHVPLPSTPRAPPGNHSTNLDYLVDFVLLILRTKLREMGRDHIRIPDVDEPFKTDIVFIPVEGRFRADGGWFRNLSTIQRTGDTVATTVGSTVSLLCSLGLQTMEFGFKNYEANLGSITASGSLYGQVASNAISAQMSLTYVNDTCKATLDSLKITHLSGINVQLTGWDGFGWLLSFIANCATGGYHNKIVSAVERQLAATIEKELSHFQCDHFFHQALNQA